MNFKRLCLILPLLCSKVFSNPVITESTDEDINLSDVSDIEDSFYEEYSVTEIIEKEEPTPLITETTDILLNEETPSLESDINLNYDDNIFSEALNNVVTDIIDFIEEDECSTKECIETSKYILNNMDTSVNPCEDFYHYACGGWESEILSKNIYGSNFNFMQDKVMKKLYKIIKGEYVVNEALSNEEQEYSEKLFKKLQNIYNIYKKREIDENYLDKYIVNFINDLNITENKENLKDLETFTNLIVKLQTNGIDLFTNLLLDTRNNDVLFELRYSSELYNHMKYLKDAQEYPIISTIYKDYIKKVLSIIKLEHDNDIDSVADSILKMIMKFSEILINIDNESTDNKSEDNNRLNIKKLNEKYPFMNWDLYFKQLLEFFDLDINIKDRILVSVKDSLFYENLHDIINESNADDIIYFIEWIIINNNIFSMFLSESIHNANNEFYDKYYKMVYPNEMYNGIYKTTDIIDTIVKTDIIDTIVKTDIIDTMVKTDIIDTMVKTDIIDTMVKTNTVDDMVKTYTVADMVKTYSVDDIVETDSVDDMVETDIVDDIDENDKQEINNLIFENGFIRMALSKLYINSLDKNDLNKARKDVKEMIENIRETMIQRIPKMEWLDEETKEKAIEKTLKMKEIIGYDEDKMSSKKIYEKYEKFDINDYFSYIVNKEVLDLEQILRCLSKDDTLLGLEMIVNAYYVPENNSIFIAASILQQPFYWPNVPDYINYGLFGSIIGHELTHAFDNNGRLFDANGNKNNWWTENDDEEFNEYAQCFIDQYNSMTYTDDGKTLNIDGKQTLGENLADNGGLARAYDAWKISLLKNSEDAAERNKMLPGFEGLTRDQLFYIGYGQSKCGREDYYSVTKDVHAPSISRVNGVVANSEHFAKTFNCPRNHQ